MSFNIAIPDLCVLGGDLVFAPDIGELYGCQQKQFGMRTPQSTSIGGMLPSCMHDGMAALRTATDACNGRITTTFV